MPRVTEPLDLRIRRRVIAEANGCWTWTGAKNADGYGRITLATGRTGGYTTFTHRVAYEVFVGPIADGLTIDHLCRNRACCNPAHLEPVTRQENLRRGRAAAQD